jgi:anthranilate phosphoribosyltransferase
VAAGLDQDLKAGIERARDVIDSGTAKMKLEQLIEFTNSISA